MKIKKIVALNYIRAKFQILSLFSTRKAAEQAFTLFCTPQEEPLSRVPSVFKFAEPVQVQLRGLKINGYQWNKGQPEKVLILHGYSSGAYKFHHFILPLVERGYEVLAFDAQAHGSSEGNTIHAVNYREMIEMVIKKYGPVTRFIAHSFGGIAVCLALENTTHDENTRIVLIAPATETSTGIDSAFRMLGIKNKKVRAGFEDIILKLSGHPAEWFSLNRAMHNIKASVLWIHDEDDRVTPLCDALKVKEKNFPNIHFLITKGLGTGEFTGMAPLKIRCSNFYDPACKIPLLVRNNWIFQF